ncbi:hypothetical protein [Mucilaginibacter endophyticus]|nr:hypothetical protein [Mucilaginibacter endophyticus]
MNTNFKRVRLNDLEVNVSPVQSEQSSQAVVSLVVVVIIAL